MKVIARQPMTKFCWADIIVEMSDGHYVITLHLLVSQHYAFGDLHWQHRQADFPGTHPIEGYLTIERGKGVQRGTYNRWYVQDLLSEYWCMPEVRCQEAPMTFPTFWEARRWFVHYDPIPMLIKRML